MISFSDLSGRYLRSKNTES